MFVFYRTNLWLKKRPGSCIACLLLAGAALGLVLPACSPLNPPLSQLPTTSPTATVTPTTTPIWFPPTPTRTPLVISAGAAITSTQDLSPLYGDLLLAEDFSKPENWQLGHSYNGNIALGMDELTMAVTRENGYLFSLHQGESFSDFYAEISASPSICRGEDEYGLLLRVSASLEFFRYGLTCNGYVRLDRFYQDVASAPQPPLMSGAVPLGAPSRSRMAVWALGGEMHFYANEQYLFSVQDPSLPSGVFGVYVRAAGPDPVTVNFSNLKVYEISE
jgi:hypothetical protein